MPIHPTAIVAGTSEVDPSADIGAYAVVEAHSRIGANARLYPHAYVSAYTTLGARCEVHPFAVVGHLPQDLKFKNEPSYCEVGADTVVREHATIHRGTMPESRTIVGEHCFLMSGAHIGHNCTVGNHVIMANTALLAGHVEVGDRAFLSGSVLVHQFCRIGEMVMMGGGSAITRDVPPFMLVYPPAMVLGPNVVGLRRQGFSPEERQEIRLCHRLLYRSGLPMNRAVTQIEKLVQTDVGRRFLAFLQAPNKRGFTPGLRRRHAIIAAHEHTD